MPRPDHREAGAALSDRPAPLPGSPSCVHAARADAGFTLLEVLAVAVVLGILAGLLFPAVSAARRSAQAARTKVLFAQWAAAIESFRAEYGHYPGFDASALVNGGVRGGPDGTHPFHDVLAGRRRNGAPLDPADAAAAQNRKRIAFHTFAAGEITSAADAAPHLIRDASGNTEIAVLVDRDLDGFIRFGPQGDYPRAPAVAGRVPGATEVPAGGLRAGVAFYAPAPGADGGDRRLVLSWQ